MQENIVTKETLKHALQGAGGGGGLYRHTLTFPSGSLNTMVIISKRQNAYVTYDDLLQDFEALNFVQIYYYPADGITLSTCVCHLRTSNNWLQFAYYGYNTSRVDFDMCTISTTTEFLDTVNEF